MRALGRGAVVASAAALVMALLPMTAAHAADGQAPLVSAVLATPNPVNLPGHVHLTATVDDSTTGASLIASAQYRIGTGAWVDMLPVDGAFNEVTEDVEVTFLAPSPTGDYVLSVRGEDALLNTSAGTDNVTLTVKARPHLTLTGATVTEGDVGTTPLSFTVDYAVLGGTAVGGVDFQAVAPGTLTWASGDATPQTVIVQVIGDLVDENSESFSITLSNPLHSTVPLTTVQGVITDNDPPPTVNVADTSIREPRKGTLLVQFRVYLSVVSGKDVTVRFATANGSAKAGRDYVATTGTLTIPAGRGHKLVHVKIMGDSVREPNQTFFLHLFSPKNATLGDPTAVCVIRNFG